MGTLQPLVFALAAIFFVKWGLGKLLSLHRAYPGLKVCPGGTLLFINPFHLLGALLSPFYPFTGWVGDWYGGFDQYVRYGSTCIFTVFLPLLGSKRALPVVWIADASVFHEISTDKVRYDKFIETYEHTNVFGENIVAAPRESWKRHRAVANPAFNEANIALVWKETWRVVHEWFASIDTDDTGHECRSEVLVEANKVFTQMSFLIFSAASLGIRTSWNPTSTSLYSPSGSTGTNNPSSVSDLESDNFAAALASISGFLRWKVIPDWLYHLCLRHVYIPGISRSIRKTQESFDYLTRCLLDLASKAREEIDGPVASNAPEKFDLEGSGTREAVRSTRRDGALLRNLVEANMRQDLGEDSNLKKLSDGELLSDMMMFFLAGHHTTAHTLSFAAVLLALYPHVQQKVFEEVMSLWQAEDSDNSNKTSLSELTYTNAVVLETLRFFPSVPRLGKKALVDTLIRARRFQTQSHGGVGAGNDVQPQDLQMICIPVKKGSMVLLDIRAVHMNPIHWGDDVKEFRPERFIDTESYRWPRGAFQAFSSGSRACIGQRFAMTEAVCIIANLVRRYEILVPEELRGKSSEEQRRILLKWRPAPTATPLNARVVLRRRESMGKNERERMEPD